MKGPSGFISTLVLGLLLLRFSTCTPVHTADGLVTEMTLDRNSYAAGDTLRLWITVHNTGDECRELTFSGLPVLQVSVRNLFGSEVIYWPDYVLWLATHVTLQPGESHTDSCRLALVSDGPPLLPGPYWVRGNFACPASPYAEQPITIVLGAP
jgi:hypothetical protein